MFRPAGRSFAPPRLRARRGRSRISRKSKKRSPGRRIRPNRGVVVLGALTAGQAAVIEALTSRILPSADGRPGARDAGVVYFIDKSLSTFNRAQKKVYANGVKDLDRRATRKWKGAPGFAALTPEQQDELVTDIEKTPFFQAVRFDTIVGTFALPEWGGQSQLSRLADAGLRASAAIPGALRLL